ncbi:MAG TPA: zinc-dependent metalloprotease, partial [Gemmatirosa sp.]|nr:zinc-dependent metalloprotease [Gemmatirosa sp.]
MRRRPADPPGRPTLAHVAALLLAGASAGTPAGAQPAPPAAPAASIAARAAGHERLDGFLPLHLDARTGKVLIELPRDSTRALLLATLATGLGSNPVGLDRGANGPEYVVRFDRSGDRVLAVLENWQYRSSDTANAAHVRSVREAFPPSTVAALPLVATEGGRLLVDATDFLVRDWTGVVRTLARAGQGSYALARDRSGIHRALTRGFPRNTEVDLSLTFTATAAPGPIVASIAPDGAAITLRQHVSLVALPDGAYRPRVMDPRVGYFGISFHDFAQPIQRPLVQRWIARHRLVRGPDGRIVDPIVYYVDPGIPEPVRTATLEGVRWWEQAFAQAGLPGAFRVEWLPAGADPMDARLNVVQWENRNERGWSIGGTMQDPRTGEIVKGMARMDSHRARTDYNLYAGLVGAEAAAADTAFVLARVRQVSAHEVGHTLGLSHNYIASTYERGSVMDYPPPRVTLDARGEIDLSRAYAVGPGAYDVWAVRWGYGTFPAASEADSLRAIAEEGLRRGFLYLSDADARPEFASDPRVNLWDDAATPEEFWRRQLAVRRVAMSRFGERAVRPGDPLALLHERFAPVYFMHRFALNSLAKTVGGMEYANAVRGDGQQATRPVAPARQRAALALLADGLAPAALAVPDTVRTLLGPNAGEVTPPVELFRTRTAPAFDALGAARTLAQMTVDAVLQRERAARLVQQHAFDPAQLSLAEAIGRLATATRWGAATPASARGADAALERVAQRALFDRLLALAADTAAAPEVRAVAELEVGELGARA